MPTVSSLHIYPIKSLGGITLSTVQVTDRGFQYDRRWMLIDSNGRFLSQRELPAMTLLQTAIDQQYLRVFNRGATTSELRLPIVQETGNRLLAKIWERHCEVLHVSDDADAWFSSQLKTSCRLVYMPDSSRLAIDEKYYKGGITSLSDGFPVLITSEASLKLLSQKAGISLEMIRFRPNLVLSNCAAHDEDQLMQLEVNGIPMQGVKQCARCKITTIDPVTATSSEEPLLSLSTYRQINNKVYFGTYVVPESTGIIQVGDEVNIVKWRKE